MFELKCIEKKIQSTFSRYYIEFDVTLTATNAFVYSLSSLWMVSYLLSSLPNSFLKVEDITHTRAFALSITSKIEISSKGIANAESCSEKWEILYPQTTSHTWSGFEEYRFPKAKLPTFDITVFSLWHRSSNSR